MSESTEHYLSQYEKQSGLLPGSGTGWINEYRDSSLSEFRRSGFPTQRDEDWRYTSIRPITNKQFTAVESTAQDQFDPSAYAIDGLDSHQIVFLDGVFQPSLSSLESLSKGLRIDSIANVLNERPESIQSHFGSAITEGRHGFTSLNNAFSVDGVVIEIDENCEVEKSIELLFINRSPDSLVQPRNLIIAHNNSKAAIIERYTSADDVPTFTNSSSEVVLEKNAEIDYHLVQTQSRKAYQVSGIWAKQAASSRFSCRTVTLGGALVRNDLKTTMSGAEAHCDMLGLYSLSGRQHVDNHTTMIHAAEYCTSNELYKGVLDQRSRGVFHGRIKVEPGAQKTDAEQTNNTLLLSRDAEIDTKPQLEIYADDVKCSHGATVGQIDETSLFYLRSRGIDEADARSLLTFAFVNDVLSEVNIEPLKTFLEEILSSQLINDADR